MKTTKRNERAHKAIKETEAFLNENLENFSYEDYQVLYVSNCPTQIDQKELGLDMKELEEMIRDMQ